MSKGNISGSDSEVTFNLKSAVAKEGHAGVDSGATAKEILEDNNETLDHSSQSVNNFQSYHPSDILKFLLEDKRLEKEERAR